MNDSAIKFVNVSSKSPSIYSCFERSSFAKNKSAPDKMVPGGLVYFQKLSCTKKVDSRQKEEKLVCSSPAERQQDLLEWVKGQTMSFFFQSFSQNILDLPMTQWMTSEMTHKTSVPHWMAIICLYLREVFWR